MKRVVVMAAKRAGNALETGVSAPEEVVIPAAALRLYRHIRLA